MAAQTDLRPAGGTDRDLASIQEARELARRARRAQAHLGELSQERIDAIVDAMAAAVTPQAETLARLAVEETGFGVVADKVQKNLFSSERVYRFIRPMRTVGVVNRIEDRKVVEIAEPFGVVAAIVPSTNPTSTAIYKILIALKARCAIVLSPHPSAVRCISRTAEIMAQAARAAGAPDGQHPLDDDRHARGDPGADEGAGGGRHPRHRRDGAGAGRLLRRQAGLRRGPRQCARLHRAVGGRAQGRARHHHRQDLRQRRALLVRKLGRGRRSGRRPGASVVHGARCATSCSGPEIDAVARVLVTPQRLPNPALVGKSALDVAGKAGISVPAGTRVLIAPLAGVGRDFPLSIEKLCPVLSYYVVKDWREGCERCMQILRYGGMGHTMAIHSRDDAVILEFGLKKPAFRICVNTPTTLGSIGLTTGLDPAMTLGCGGFGGNITSDNITPRHLLNIKRLAYEVRPAPAVRVAGGSASAQAPSSDVRLPRPPQRPAAEPVSAESLSRRIDQFLQSRGIGGSPHSAAPAAPPAPAPAAPPVAATAPPAVPEPFVCEDDVRAAARANRKILIDERTIVTPAARDAGEALRIFEQASWRP